MLYIKYLHLSKNKLSEKSSQKKSDYLNLLTRFFR